MVHNKIVKWRQRAISESTIKLHNSINCKKSLSKYFMGSCQGFITFKSEKDTWMSAWS